MLFKISERNQPKDVPLKVEYEKIRELFCDTEVFRSKSNKCYTYLEMLDIHFLSWDLKGLSLNSEQMINALEISDKDFAKDISKSKNKDVSENRILHYVQFVINALHFIEMVVGYPYTRYYEDNVGKTIKEHCRYLLNRLNAEVKMVQSELCVSYKNDVAAAVSIQQPELKASIIDYLRIDNENNLQRKHDILCGLSNILEPHNKLLDNDYGLKLYDSTSFLLNNAGIRHAFKPGNIIHAKFQAMSKEELIKWYDRTFQMILACLAEMPYLKYRNEIMELKGKNNSQSAAK